MPKFRKALNYDLDDILLKKHYPNPKSYKNTWRQVKKFLYSKGFENRQYSGVVSIEPMSYFNVTYIVKSLNKNYSWIGPCVLAFDVTNVGPTYDLNIYSINNIKLKSITKKL